jgi:hypothetical protein
MMARGRVSHVSVHLLNSRLALKTESASGGMELLQKGDAPETMEGSSLTVEEDNELIERLNAEVLAESGVELEQLINPSKVVNLERDLITLGRQIEASSSEEEKASIRELMDKKRGVLAIEKRAVMRDWLKNLFVAQSVLAGVISYAVVHHSIEAPLSVQALSFWTWWLFIIPSLRARKPKKEEKEALNISFLLTPLVSAIMPAFTRDVELIWWGNAAATAACYAYAYLKPASEPGPEGAEQSGPQLPSWVIKAYKALDYGSGQERGERK